MACEEAEERLLAAARRADLAGVVAALNEGADPSAREGGLFREGAIGLALTMGGGKAIECVLELVARGADPNGVDWQGRSALMLAARAGSLEAVGALLSAGANHGARCHKGFSALHFATADLTGELVEALLRAGADPSARSVSGWTPLLSAASDENPAAVAALLRAGADPDSARLPPGRNWRPARARLLERAWERQELEGVAPRALARSARVGL